MRGQAERKIIGVKIYIWAAVILLLCAGALWYVLSTHLTMGEVIRLSNKGEALRAADFPAYKGKCFGDDEVNITWYDVLGDYELAVDFWDGSDVPSTVRLYYRGTDDCCIDIRYSDVSQFVAAADKSDYVMGSRYMTMEDVKQLSRLGEGLRMEHLIYYSHELSYWDTAPAPDGISFTQTYPIDGQYQLKVGDHDLAMEAAYIRLVHIKSGEYIDIRTDDVEEFLSKMTPRRMTMEDVRALSKKGEMLSKEDLKPFAGAQESDLYVFDIDDDFLLRVSESMYHDGLGQVYLQLRENWRYHMDIRYGDIDAFIAQADAYKGEQKKLTTEDIIRISQKGTELKPIDFAAYYMPEPPYLAEYEIEGGYSLRILEMEGFYGDDLSFRLWWNGSEGERCAIDLRVHDAQAFISAEDKSQYILGSRTMTMEDVKQLAELGEDLWAEHFIHYDLEIDMTIDELWEAGEAEVVAACPVDEEYRLELWDDDCSFGGQRELVYVYLTHIESGEYIDIRIDDVAAFLEKHTK